ncbi:unnamed protein product [Amoebophrya sp. A25]|nr:unnamed protein product [Amoebophrya sp. A25]|eukprot:GSA25T00003419001.1
MTRLLCFSTTLFAFAAPLQVVADLARSHSGARPGTTRTLQTEASELFRDVVERSKTRIAKGQTQSKRDRLQAAQAEADFLNAIARIRDKIEKENMKMSAGGANIERAQIFVTGKVQGVYYRDTTKKKAESLGLVGAAWNLKDGRVEIIAEGPKELEQWCYKGPEGAKEVGLDNELTAKRKVTNVEAKYSKPQGDYIGKGFKNAGKK